MFPQPEEYYYLLKTIPANELTEWLERISKSQLTGNGSNYFFGLHETAKQTGPKQTYHYAHCDPVGTDNRGLKL